MSYPDTYYSRTLSDSVERPALGSKIDCDVAIVGGGLAGLTAALQLVRGGMSVVVLEAQSVGFGASGRNGGFVSPGYSAGMDDIARMAGIETAHALHRLSIEGVEFVRQTIEEQTAAQITPVSGIMSVVRYDAADMLKRRAENLHKDYGYHVDFLDSEQIRARLNSARYFQGLRDKKAFHIHPLNYLRSLAGLIEQNGGRIYEKSTAIECDFSGPVKILRTHGGQVNAAHVVLATGGYTTALVKPLYRAFLPIATYVMLTEKAPELISSAVRTSDAIGDNRRAADYYRLVENGSRILWGGRITTRTGSTTAPTRELRREMLSTFPQLAQLRTELSWSGLMSYARHLMPQIGLLQPRIWYCTAFGGHGLNTTAIGGKVVAEAILGQSDRYRLFTPFGLSWAGGHAGLAVAQLTYWKLQLQDWWRESKAG